MGRRRTALTPEDIVAFKGWVRSDIQKVTGEIHGAQDSDTAERAITALDELMARRKRLLILAPDAPAQKVERKRKAAAPEVETVQPGEKGTQRQRVDKAVKRYLQAKRPPADDTQRVISYRTEATVGHNQAFDDGADAAVIEFLFGEAEWALAHVPADVRSRFVGDGPARDSPSTAKSRLRHLLSQIEHVPHEQRDAEVATATNGDFDSVDSVLALGTDDDLVAVHKRLIGFVNQ